MTANAFSGQRLAIARDLRLLTKKQLAEQVGVTPGAISHYEGGGCKPEESVMLRLCTALHVPVGFLLAEDNLPEVPEVSFFWRSRVSTRASARHYVTSRHLLFHEFVSHLRKYVRLPALNLPKLDDGVKVDPRTAAIAIRRSWGLGDGPIPNMVDLLERNGVWIHLLGGEVTSDIDAFSVRHDGGATIFLNPAKQDAYRSRFDAAHELGHLIMHEQRDEIESRAQEREADMFAGEFLVPSHIWRRECPRSSNPWHFHACKERWKVSASCLILQGHLLEAVNDRQYQSLQVRLSQLGWRRGEPGMAEVSHEQPRLIALCLDALGRTGITLDQIAATLKYPSWLIRELAGVNINSVSVPVGPGNVIPFRRPQ